MIVKIDIILGLKRVFSFLTLIMSVVCFLTYFIIRTFLEIRDISPSCGSLQGGTVITIQGLGFSDYPNNVVVEVGGV